MKLVLLAFMFTTPNAFAALQSVAHCNVSEIPASGSPQTSSHKFMGDQEEIEFKLKLFSEMKVILRGSPGAIDDYQAFVVIAKIQDAQTQVNNTVQAYFTNKRKYAETFAKVIPGTLMVRQSRPNGDRVEVSCFNPRK